MFLAWFPEFNCASITGKRGEWWVNWKILCVGSLKISGGRCLSFSYWYRFPFYITEFCVTGNIPCSFLPVMLKIEPCGVSCCMKKIQSRRINVPVHSRYHSAENSLPFIKILLDPANKIVCERFNGFFSPDSCTVNKSIFPGSQAFENSNRQTLFCFTGNFHCA